MWDIMNKKFYYLVNVKFILKTAGEERTRQLELRGLLIDRTCTNSIN